MYYSLGIQLKRVPSSASLTPSPPSVAPPRFVVFQSHPPAPFTPLCHMCIRLPISLMTKTSMRLSPFLMAATLPVQDPSSRLVQFRDQPLFGATCHLWYILLSVPITKTSSRPSRLRLTAGGLSTTPPKLSIPDQPLFGTCCQRWRTSPPRPVKKTSIRPSRFSIGAGLGIVTGPPSDSQPDQPLFARTCQMCHKALSVPRAKTSKRPSAFWPTDSDSIPAIAGLRNDSHWDQPLL